jgi:hypothetical protein
LGQEISVAENALRAGRLRVFQVQTISGLRCSNSSQTRLVDGAF